MPKILDAEPIAYEDAKDQQLLNENTSIFEQFLKWSTQRNYMLLLIVLFALSVLLYRLMVYFESKKRQDAQHLFSEKLKNRQKSK